MSLFRGKSDGGKIKFSDLFRRRSSSLPRKTKEERRNQMESLYASIVSNNNNNNNNVYQRDFMDGTPYVSMNEYPYYPKGPPVPPPPPHFRDVDRDHHQSRGGGIYGFLRKRLLHPIFSKSSPHLDDRIPTQEENEQMRRARLSHLQHLMRHLAARSLEEDEGWRRRLEERRRREAEERRRSIFHSERRSRSRRALSEDPNEARRRREFEAWRRRFQERKRAEEDEMLTKVRGRRRRREMWEEEEEDNVVQGADEDNVEKSVEDSEKSDEVKEEEAVKQSPSLPPEAAVEDSFGESAADWR